MVKITSLEIENVKRVKALRLEPAASGLTVIGGRNGQGKTSVLDAIAWALGGDRLKPDQPQRQDSVLPPEICVRLSNGIVVERRGKSGALKVTDPSGRKSGQQLLNTFVEQLALDLPKFMQASDREKADTLLKVIGVGDELARLDREITQRYNERLALGRIADQKRKYYQEMPFYEGMPEAPVSASELIRQQQDILARNAQRLQWGKEYDAIMAERQRVDRQVEEAEARLRELKAAAARLEEQSIAAQKSPAQMRMESTEALEANIAQVDEINRKVRANLDREKANEDAKDYAAQYDTLTGVIDDLRAQRRSLLNGAALPLPDLGVSEDGRLTYRGYTWDGMSSSEQLRVAAAIVRALNPECGFVLMDKLEQMDADTMRAFGQWLEEQGLQVIATRVSTDGGECAIIIEDGEAVKPTAAAAWKEGEF
jgi:Holliday junction resolvase-like predicted endonuclease